MCIYINRWTNHLTTIKEVHMNKIQVLEDNIKLLKDKVMDAAADKNYSEMARLGMIISINEKLIEIIKATTGDK